ncbi:MAG: hypothetical protein PHT12_06270 [Patescibacteria group bacterium]|nr:hypothetical protein [Patescibacteria group bacterium]
MRKWYANWYVIVIFLLSGVAVAMASLVFLLLPQSGEVIRIMQWRMVRANSFRFDARLDYRGDAARRNDYGALVSTPEGWAVDTAGAVDRTPDPKKAATASVPFRTITGFSVRVGAQEPTLDFAGEVRHVDKRDYVNFNALPEHMGPVRLADYADKWLSLNVDALRKRIDLPFFGAAAKPMSPVDEARFVEDLRLTPFFVFEGQIGTEKVNGARAWHYKVKPEILFIKDYVFRLEQARLGRELTVRERDAMDRFFADVTADDGEIWIGQRDYYLYRLRLRFNYDDGLHRGVFSLTSDFTGFNQPLDIRAPEGEKLDMNAVAESLLPGLVTQLPLAQEGGVPLPASGGLAETASGGLPVSESAKPTGDSDPDKDGLPDALEFFYGTDPNNADTDGDGVSDGDEVASGKNPKGPGLLFDFGLSTMGQ